MNFQYCLKGYLSRNITILMDKVQLRVPGTTF